MTEKCKEYGTEIERCPHCGKPIPVKRESAPAQPYVPPIVIPGIGGGSFHYPQSRWQPWQPGSAVAWYYTASGGE